MIYLMKTDCHDPATLINPKHFRNIVSACPSLIRANKHEHRNKQTVHDMIEYFTEDHRIKMHPVLFHVFFLISRHSFP